MSVWGGGVHMSLRLVCSVNWTWFGLGPSANEISLDVVGVLGHVSVNLHDCTSRTLICLWRGIVH